VEAVQAVLGRCHDLVVSGDIITGYGRSSCSGQ
jgi:hypothetical protein